MVPRPGWCKPDGRVVSVTAESRSEEAAQEPPDSVEQSAEESADAGYQAADGAHETAYHAHLSITCMGSTRDRVSSTAVVAVFPSALAGHAS